MALERADRETKTAASTRPTLDALREEFHRDCLDRGMASESVRRYESCFGTFLDFLAEQDVDVLDVGNEQLIRYIRNRRGIENPDGGKGVKQKTLENDFAAINAFYDFAEFKGYILRNPVPPIRKRYLARYKEASADDSEKNAISVEQMAMLINSILNTRDKAIVLLLAKTGIRRGELIALNLSSINWAEHSLTLGHFKKRSNRVVFFDDETGRALKSWLRIRETMNSSVEALFLNERGEQLQRNGVYSLVTKYALKIGLHKPESENPKDHFNVHSCRHWFTTWLRRGGMDRDAIAILRGDRRKASMSVYDHFSHQELRTAYLSAIPQLGL